jgi:hypothetical protein
LSNKKKKKQEEWTKLCKILFFFFALLFLYFIFKGVKNTVSLNKKILSSENGPNKNQDENNRNQVSKAYLKNVENVIMRYVGEDIIRKENYAYDTNQTTRIFCLLLTKREDLDSKTKFMLETWTKACDNFKFITLLADKLMAINNENFSVMIFHNQLFDNDKPK